MAKSTQSLTASVLGSRPPSLDLRPTWDDAAEYRVSWPFTGQETKTVTSRAMKLREMVWSRTTPSWKAQQCPHLPEPFRAEVRHSRP